MNESNKDIQFVSFPTLQEALFHIENLKESYLQSLPPETSMFITLIETWGEFMVVTCKLGYFVEEGYVLSLIFIRNNQVKQHDFFQVSR